MIVITKIVQKKHGGALGKKYDGIMVTYRRFKSTDVFPGKIYHSYFPTNQVYDPAKLHQQNGPILTRALQYWGHLPLWLGTHKLTKVYSSAHQGG